MENKIKGVIERIVEKSNCFNFRIGEDWYGVFKIGDVKEFDEVEFEYKMNGEFKNVVGEIKVLGHAMPSVKENIGEIRRRTICLGYAKDLVIAEKISLNNMIKYAEEMVKYIKFGKKDAEKKNDTFDKKEV